MGRFRPTLGILVLSVLVLGAWLTACAGPAGLQGPPGPKEQRGLLGPPVPPVRWVPPDLLARRGLPELPVLVALREPLAPPAPQPKRLSSAPFLIY